MQTENHYTETDLGNVSPNPRGDYNNTVKYEYLDLVTMQGGSYLCVIPVGQTITGTAPEPGKTTEHWQCLTMPGDMTPQYTEAHDKVVRLAKEVAQNTTKVAEDKQSVAQMETDVRQLKEQTAESARQAENSKDSAVGSARAAKTAEDNIRQVANNVNTLVNGFDTHVAEKTTEATQAVATAKDNAVQAVERQETASVQEVKDQTATYITEQKNLAKQELDDKVNQFGLDVNVIKAEVSKEGQKQITNVQEATTAELAKITEKGTEQTEAVAKEGTKQVQAVQTAAQEIITDREQIAKNKADIAEINVLNKQLQDALISQKISGSNIKVTNSAKLPIVKLSVFGKSEQVQTTGAQLLNYYKLAELSPQYYVIEQGELKVKGSDNATWTSVPECDTLAAGTYTLSGNNIEIRDVSKNTVIATCIGDTFSKFTLNEDTAIKIKVGYGLDKYPIVVKAMLNKGDSKKPYEPYTGGKPSPSIEYPQEITNCGENGTINLEIAGDNAEPQTLIIPTPNGLLGLKVDVNGNYTDENGQQWICDEIDLARGKYVQRIRKIILDGNIDTKHVGQHENGTKYLGIILQEKDYTLKASNMLCTRYIRAEWTNKNGYVYSAKKDTVIITDNRFTDVETTKKIIGEEKPVIIYPLLTPIETDLPPETIAAFKRLRTNYPNTIISNNADAGMELTYTADTQSYVDSKITTLSKAML